MYKIVFTGPESTGKSWLSKSMSQEFGIPWVHEYSREFLSNLSKQYSKHDLLTIAHAQLHLEDVVTHVPAVLLDTNLLTLKIWSLVKYGDCDPWICQTLRARQYDHYFLCYPDIPWEYDPLREHQSSRHELFRIYEQSLIDLSASYHIITGTYDERMDKVRFYLKKLLEP